MIDIPEKDNKIMSRFLAKVALETLAQKNYPAEGWFEEIIEKKELEPLREYIRYGNNIKFWEYHQRRVYDETDRFLNPKTSESPYEVLHEQDLAFLKGGQLYLVLILFGIEYVINFISPKIDNYKELLEKNNNRSPIIRENERITIKNKLYKKWPL